MKKSILLLIIINFNLIAYNQVIKGTIYDNKTKEIVYSASVYYNGTSVGTLSDLNGNFKLDISKYPSMPLTVSAIGYYSVTIKDISATKPLLIYLNPKLFELDEVLVKAKTNPLQRMENLTIFRNEFLGTTGNAMNCEIVNENDIRFKYSANRDTMKAFATKPLLINNKALGYKITYYLDKFEYDKQSKTFFFRGNIIIIEDSTLDESKKQSVERKRKNAYLGSRMHFFRALWVDDLNSNGFTVRNSANEILGYNKIVFKQNSQTKYLSYHTDLGIAYYSKQTTTYLILFKDKVFFDASGYYDPLLITWEGEMSRQRIADLLPYEYSFK